MSHANLVFPLVPSFLEVQEVQEVLLTHTLYRAGLGDQCHQDHQSRLAVLYDLVVQVGLVPL